MVNESSVADFDIGGKHFLTDSSSGPVDPAGRTFEKSSSVKFWVLVQDLRPLF